MMANSHQNLRAVMQGGGSLINCRPVFSRDSKYLICASGRMLQVYSVDNDVCCKSMNGHQAVITSIITNPKNEFQVFSSSVDKTVICWDYIDGVILHHYKFGLPVWNLFTLVGDQTRYFSVVQVDKDLHNCFIAEFDFRRARPDGVVEVRKMHRGVHSDPNHTAISCKGSYLAFIKGKTSVFVIDCGQTKNYEFKVKQTITSIACHPSEYCVATGCKGGQIYLWRSFTVPGTEPVSTELHWHSLDVYSLCFSMEGSYLLSGGHECVLAKWMTDSASKTPADTLPRLGAQIVNVSCSADNRHYALSYADNGIQVIGNNFFRGPTIQGLMRGFRQSFDNIYQVDEWSAPVGLLHDPRTGCLVTNGRPGQLQFYNVGVNRQLFSLNIVGHNYVSPDSLDKPLKPTVVENAAFDSSGDWLVTFERRDDGSTAPETRLKFWHYSSEKGSFILNTCVDTPHHKQLYGLKFRPNQLLEDKRSMLVVSSSADGSIKTWSLISDDTISDVTLRWSCSGIGVYRGQEGGSVDFSEDGSILAAVFKDVITFWYPAYCCMCKDIISIPDNELSGISDVSFGRHASRHLLIFHTSDRLYCWNLLSFTLQWCIPANVSVLVMNPVCDLMAVFTKDKQLILMSPKSATPVYKLDAASNERVVMACFLPSSAAISSLPWQSKARLYFLTVNQELYGVFNEDEVDSDLHKTAPIQQQNVETRSVFSMLIGTENGGRRISAVNVVSQAQTQTRSKFVEEALNNQFIAMPPMSLLCMSFMDTLLLRKAAVTADDDESDSDSAVDVAELKLPDDDSDMDTL